MNPSPLALSFVNVMDIFSSVDGELDLVRSDDELKLRLLEDDDKDVREVV